MNVNYVGEATLTNRFSNSIVRLSFVIANCSKTRVAVQENIIHLCRFLPAFPGGGVHNMLRVRVCAAHMGGFLGPKFSKQGSLFRHIFLKQGWVIQKLAKNSKKWVVFR